MFVSGCVQKMASKIASFFLRLNFRVLAHDCDQDERKCDQKNGTRENSATGTEKIFRALLLQPYLVWKPRLLSHWSRQAIQEFVAHWKVCQKSSEREVVRTNAYIAPKPQSVLLPALHLEFSRSLKNFQVSPARQSSLRLKDRRPNHVV